tara:strand:+ start:565 stop:678 length:114 start_codon:yes stop_codon:yes gene_type:complete
MNATETIPWEKMKAKLAETVEGNTGTKVKLSEPSPHI